MGTGYLIMGILVMAFTTYLIRVMPMVIFRKKITNVYVRSFLYYVPYAVLSAMTFPAIFFCTDSLAGSIAGCLVAVILAYNKKGLVTVAIGAALAVFAMGFIG